MPRISREDLLMAQAILTAQRSTCLRKQVGAVIAHNGRIISTGYAGAPAGMPHCLDVGCDTSKGTGCTRTAHAEINAIAYAARFGIATDGAELYCTLSPCETCAKAIRNAGIIRVYFNEQYRDASGINLLEKSGVECIHHLVGNAIVIAGAKASASQQQSRGQVDQSSSLTKPPVQENLFKS